MKRSKSDRQPLVNVETTVKVHVNLISGPSIVAFIWLVTYLLDRSGIKPHDSKAKQDAKHETKSTEAVHPVLDSAPEGVTSAVASEVGIGSAKLTLEPNTAADFAHDTAHDPIVEEARASTNAVKSKPRPARVVKKKSLE